MLLFAFARGTSTWRFSSLPVVFTAASQTWQPGVVVPSTFARMDDIPKDGLQVKLPIDDSFAATFLGVPHDKVTTLDVFRTHYDDTEVLLYWTGRVLGRSLSGGVLTLDCESELSILRQPGISSVYQRPCRYPLFGAGCQLDAASFAVPATVTSVAGVNVTVPEAASQPDLTGGTLEAPDGTLRMIVKHVGTALTLMWPIRSLAAVAAVNLYTGCDHSYETCRTKFGNQGNWGGSLIPQTNPRDSLL